eukprot:9473169-Pyramimonas_sp.AAC.1
MPCDLGPDFLHPGVANASAMRRDLPTPSDPAPPQERLRSPPGFLSGPRQSPKTDPKRSYTAPA